MNMSNSSSVKVPCSRFRFPMPSAFIRNLVLLVILSSIIPQKSDGQYFVEWCIADEQTPDGELQKALDWACQNGGDCREIKAGGQPCFLPNTLKDHASYAFNSYYQRMKHKGASCYFNAAAIVTALDPSHGSCKFEYLP